ncbi:ureidoglycolate lyase [Sulfitobacter sp. CW3]|uniref:ureidoglycolate lyase n=1 Tax=Sulfitobacter sp. CW3 TaxID=2861965 RepID=UPI001C5CC395|nr:ureidoglycolate lyase [Sulfitobacter sp. CW3]MBW4962793.1 ureidoglycolate lyase [Sulfitobacter sp. CW3]
MSRVIKVEPLTPDGFAPFGDIVDASGSPDKMINGGLCGRHHDLATLDFGRDGRAGISVFNAQARSLPYTLDLLERHPDGSQAFIPMTAAPFLVIAAPDEDGVPGTPRAFLTGPYQGINFFRGTWHGVLTPLATPGIFAVIDRIGTTTNLDEFPLDSPYTVTT